MNYTGSNVKDVATLSSILGSNPKELGYLSLNMDKNVRTHTIAKPNAPKELREITAPSKKLKQIQRNIKDYILADYTYASYVYGLGGNTLKDHALVHRGKTTLVQVDIKQFYPSISNKLVYKMWVKSFGFSPEVSRMLTKLTTMHGGLKQGFPTSSHIAAIVAEGLTQEINLYCATNGLKFTQYVDDLNVSGHNIDYRMIFKVIVPMGRKYNLSIKKNKTRVNHEQTGKEITGVSLLNQRTRATKAVRSKAIRALKGLADSPQDEHMKRRVAGYTGFLRHLKKSDGKKYKKLVKKIQKK